MEPNFTINREPTQNSGLFQNDFFRRFMLRPMPEPLQLSAEIKRRYHFPTLYGDVTCAIGIFLCSWERAAAMMMHPDIKPVRMPGGRSLVVFSCYEYKNVHEIGSYNEIAMTLPIMVKPTVNVPVLPMLAPGLFSKFGYYVFHMPVTSLENQIRGEKIWGLPKVVQRIDMDNEGDDCLTTGFDEQGDRYFQLRVPRIGTPTSFDVASWLYTRRGNEFLRAKTCFRSEFAVNKYSNRLFKTGGSPTKEWLQIGEGKAAEALRSLQIDPNPFQFRYTTGMSACFDLPEAGYSSPIRL